MLKTMRRFGLLILLFCVEPRSLYHLYDTDQNSNLNKLQFDCLHYFTRYEVYSLSDFSFILNEHTEYCLRPSSENNSTTHDILNDRDQNFTFAQLRSLNVTIEKLFLWSVSVDLLEQYQDYLNQPFNASISTELFFNCTRPWFGSRCQYSFGYNNNALIEGVIATMFNAKQNYINPETVTNLTCYVHLKCDRGGPYMCLDWREVCNGRIDCIDGGMDEAHCFDLEVNECGENEFRCYTGTCIADDYWKSGDHNMICPNGQLSLAVNSGKDCWKRPRTECENRMCPPGPNQFSCGDGQCVEDFNACYNGRHRLLTKSISVQGNLSYNCWIAMACLTKIVDEIDDMLCEDIFVSATIVTYLKSCDSLTQFPTIPVLFGHVRFLYNIENILYLNKTSALPPDYVCYDDQLCDFLIPTFQNGSNTCRHGYEMGFESDEKYYDWVSMINTIKSYFRGCRTTYKTQHDSRHPSLYCCKNSSKCISKHRIVDGISDCYMNDDENEFELSCSMNDTHRFKCSNENKCRSPILEQDSCSSDPMRNLDDILFQEICDGVVDLQPKIIDGRNYTDETECEHWSCNNIHRRCNKFSSCSYENVGEYSTLSICNSLSQLCVNPENYTLTCLSSDKVRNKIIDCLGASDEPDYCSIASSSSGSSKLFLCWNTTNVCVNYSLLCNGYRDCPFGDDEVFCDEHKGVCLKTALVFQNCARDALCRISGLKKYYTLWGNLDGVSLFINRMNSDISDVQMKPYGITNNIKPESIDPAWAWRCNRGLYASFWPTSNTNSYKCFCPPSYYGDLCQYQTQRVFLRVGLALVNRYGVYTIVAALIDDDDDLEAINSYDQFVTVGSQGCGEFFETYLLYSTRPKNESKNYRVRIDAFDKTSLIYIASWHFNIPFPFLPVNYLATILTIPPQRGPNPRNCPLKCINGECLKYMNANKYFCRCHTGWSGARCHLPINCSDCSSDSICIGRVNNRSICVCPLSKYGPRCLLKLSNVPNLCLNNGQCTVINPDSTGKWYVCTCPEKYSGLNCETQKATLTIHLNSIETSSYVLVYIITVFDYKPPLQKVMFQKLIRFQHTVTLYILNTFHLIVVKMASMYYLAVLEGNKPYNISMSISSARRCRSTNELLNSTVMTWDKIRQVKYYHTICQTHVKLLCFFDEMYMCLCSSDDYPNCFKFNHKPDLSCRDKTHCLNGAECLQDNQLCPLDTICICTDCYFGDQCQFYAKGIGLTLDDILRYEIRPYTTLINQALSIKMSMALTMLIFVSGLINSILSILAFQTKATRKVGCGLYLLASSITSLLTVTMLLFKFWFLILTQINVNINRSVLRGGCMSVEFLLKLSLYTDSWLNASVAIERALTVFQGVNFNKLKSKRIAQWIITLLPFVIMGTIHHEILYRDLFDDKEEQRIWCVTYYSHSIQQYHTFIQFFHFLGPFLCNLMSALFIIFTVARHRATARTEQTYKQHFCKQLKEHKQLLISPLVFVILSVPRLIISLLSGCVKSSRNPWLYLSGYFISFIPSVVIFAAFVLPSEFYKKQFKETIESWRRQIL